jgi:hypothetical protein
VHESTGTSPTSLFLGREINHSLGLKWKFADLALEGDPPGDADFWVEALNRLKKARDRVGARYNALRKEADFRVGDLVLVKLHPQSSKALQRSAKIENKWSDPMCIAKFLNEVTVQLANPDTGVIVRKAHVSQLKRYFVGDKV